MLAGKGRWNSCHLFSKIAKLVTSIPGQLLLELSLMSRLRVKRSRGTFSSATIWSCQQISQPSNKDGEVESFELVPVCEVAEVIRTSQRYKPNCALVVIDFLFRHGFIHPDQPCYLHLLRSLHFSGGSCIGSGQNQCRP